MSRKINIFNVDVDCLSMQETVESIGKSIDKGDQIVHNCINANKVVLMEKDEVLWESVHTADIVSADGQAVVWASQLFRTPLPERVPGIDLMDKLIEMAYQKGHKIFLFGAKEEIVKKVSEIYSEKYSKELIGGYRNGYFSKEEESQIAWDINASGASMLFVAIPSPQKENFIKKHREEMSNVKLLMGVGGSFDVVSGKVKRAPKSMQNNGLEWLYRLYMEPRKMWRRYLLGNIRFIRITWREYFSKSKSTKKFK